MKGEMKDFELNDAEIDAHWVPGKACAAVLPDIEIDTVSGGSGTIHPIYVYGH